MPRCLKLLPVLVLLLSLSGVVGLSCGSSSDSGDSGDAGGSGSDSETSAGESATCPTPSESATLDSKNSSWNQSLSLASGGGSVTSREVSLTLTATNSNGINAYWLSEEDATPAASDSGWTEVTSTPSLSLTPYPFTLSAGDGQKTIYGWFKDTADEVSPVACLSVTLDTGAPTGALTLDSGASTTSDLTVAVRIAGTSTNSPIVAYALSETNSTPAVDSSLWNTIAEPSTSVTITTDFTLSASAGSHTVYGWFKSQSGIISGSFSASITFSLPTVASGATPVVTEGLTVNENSTLTAGITINGGATFTASRTVSLTLSGLGTANITGYEVSESSTPSSYATISSPSTSLSTVTPFTASPADGVKTIYLHLRDSVGTTASASATITLDETVPTGSLSLDSGAKLTVDSTVSATITGTDSIGVVGYFISDSSTAPAATASGWTAVTSTTSLSTSINRSLTDLTGLSTQYLWLKDAAGNVSATISDGIEVVRIYATSSTNDIGSYSSIAVDSNNQAYISNYRANSDLFFHALVGGSLGAGLVDSVGDVGAGTSIAVDSNNKLHIAYRDTTNSKLKYAYSTNGGGSWTIDSTLNEAGGISPSIGVDSNGKVHTAHLASNKVRYVTNSSGSWTSQEVISSGTSIACSLAVGSDNSIHIAQTSISPGGLHYATSLNSWQNETVASGSNFGSIASIVVGEDGTIRISYSDENFMGVATDGGSGWFTSQIDSVGGRSGITVDSGGNTHIAYYDMTNDNLKYATDFSGSWTTTTLDSSGDVGDFCDIAIDSNDRLHISYYDATNGDLKYITTAD